MTGIFRDPDLQNEFDRNGFVVARILTNEQAAATLERVKAVGASSGFAANIPGQAPIYHVSLFDPDRNYRRAAQAVAEAVLAPPLAEVLEGYRVLSGGFIVKVAGAGAIDLHRDWTMTASADEVALNCWCALADIGTDNGCLALVPGSHMLVPNIEGPGIASFFAAYAEALKAHSVAVPLKAGEAVILDYRTLHWSGANCGDDLRVAVSAGMIPIGARHVLYLPELPDQRRFRIVEPEAADWTDSVADEDKGCQEGGRTIGCIPNNNRAVSQRQFERMLAVRDSDGSAAGLLARFRSWLAHSPVMARSD